LLSDCSPTPSRRENWLRTPKGHVLPGPGVKGGGGVRMIVVSVEEGEVIVSEAGIYALGRTPREAEALGRRLFKWLELPVVPLVLGGNGYREGVLHLPSLEALQKRPRVLEGDLEGLALWIKRFLKNDLEALAAWNRGERPRVRLLNEETASSRERREGEGGKEKRRGFLGTSSLPEGSTGRLGARVSPGLRGLRGKHLFTALVGLALLPLPFLNPLGFLALLPAFYMVLTQTVLLPVSPSGSNSQRGENDEWVQAFKILLLGVPGAALVAVFLLMPVGQALEGAVAWALLPAAVGALSVPFASRGRFWVATRLYALALSDLFPWAFLLAPLALLVGRPILAGLMVAVSLFRFLPGLDQENRGLNKKLARQALQEVGRTWAWKGIWLALGGAAAYRAFAEAVGPGAPLILAAGALMVLMALLYLVYLRHGWRFDVLSRIWPWPWFWPWV